MSKAVVYRLESRHVGGDVDQWKPVINAGRDGLGTFLRKDRAIQFARELTTWPTFVAFRVLKGEEVVWEWTRETE
jgi:hypothetical protein